MRAKSPVSKTLRVWGLLKKESYQIVRDPSSILIAFILPLILIYLFSFAVSLDFDQIKIGVAVESDSADANELVATFKESTYFKVYADTNRHQLEEMLSAGLIRGLIVIPANFNRKLQDFRQLSPIQIITDGSETNTATLLDNYARGAISNWLLQKKTAERIEQNEPIMTEFRVWYNPEVKSRFFLLPGSIAIIMTLIGTLLTSLVVAREWERGTMEALLATPVSIAEILMGKLLPYYFLGLCSLLLCVGIAVLGFHVPFEGSFILLLLISSLFLIASLSLGLLISTLSRNQFLASQAALNSAFLPAFLLSGFIFEIHSMPQVLQYITYIFPPRYFVSSLKMIFLTGDAYEVLFYNSLGIFLIACVLIFFVAKNTRKRLD